MSRRRTQLRRKAHDYCWYLGCICMLPRVPAMIVDRCPILKQMMRHTTSNMGLCGPSPEDTPIHPWMLKHGIEPLPYGASWATSLNASLSPADARRGGARLGGALEGDTGHSTESRPGQPLITLIKAETTPAASSSAKL